MLFNFFWTICRTMGFGPENSSDHVPDHALWPIKIFGPSAGPSALALEKLRTNCRTMGFAPRKSSDHLPDHRLWP